MPCVTVNVTLAVLYALYDDSVNATLTVLYALYDCKCDTHGTVCPV